MLIPNMNHELFGNQYRICMFAKHELLSDATFYISPHISVVKMYNVYIIYYIAVIEEGEHRVTLVQIRIMIRNIAV